jgi:hypothetical protein
MNLSHIEKNILQMASVSTYTVQMYLSENETWGDANTNPI